MDARQVALQLYTLRERAGRDFPGTLAEIARIGYRAVELAGFYGLPVETIRAELDRHGLRAVAAHVPYDDFDTRADQVLAELKLLGCAHAVLPSLPPRLCSVDAVGEVAERLSSWGARCVDSGVQLSYHNHSIELEMRSASGETFFELLAAGTDASLVGFELDVYWAHVGGADPVGLIHRHAARVRLLHLKDFAPGGSDAPFGEGTLPWPDVIEAARQAAVEWYVVEQDHPADALRDVETSFRNAQRMAARR